MNLLENVERIQERILNAQRRSGNDNSVEIVAITKTHPPELIGEILKTGIRSIGENRVQEAENKFKKLPTDLTKSKKRLVGHLQSNKINKALQLFDFIDSIDSFSLAKKVSNKTKSQNRSIPVLLEINTSEESAKFGFNPDNLEDMLACFNIDGIEVQGLMTVGPLTSDMAKIRNSFQTLSKLFYYISSQISDNKKFTELSMGMSGDFEIAIEEGATMVRLGTVLFGTRGNYK